MKKTNKSEKKLRLFMNNLKFELINENDFDDIFKMMRDFYSSPAVINKIEDAIIIRDIKSCIDKSINLQGYKVIFEDNLSGYFMLTESYSTEFGCKCIWIEDIYIKENYRHRGIGTEIFKYIKKLYPVGEYRLRLEVEKNNTNAKKLYTKSGFELTEYDLMEISPKNLKNC